MKQSDTRYHSESFAILRARPERSEGINSVRNLNKLVRRGVYPEHIRGACTERIEVLSVNSAEGLLAKTKLLCAYQMILISLLYGSSFLKEIIVSQRKYFHFIATYFV
ncbi:MAG: hypothetical protein HYW01_13085 [Deltaproteobacteria bacterium]|nr:hypothetical protein [Deltaproteobacteria bacterium]